MAIKIKEEKPWARLRVSRREYETARPWKKTPLSREAFDALVLTLPVDILDGLRLEADAERLIAAAFGAAAVEPAEVQEQKGEVSHNA